MRIMDSRDGRFFDGELVAALPANESPSDADIKRYYGVIPGHRSYEIIKRPQPMPRMVLQRGEPEDHSYYIIPRYDFYVEAKDEVAG
jgi:hypothetical protein